MREKLYIVGVGPGSREFLSPLAESVVRSADRVLGTSSRIVELYDNYDVLSLTELFDELELPASGATAVLVGGDSGFFSITSRIGRDFSDRYEIACIPGISSISCFSARIGVNYDDARLVSLHGRPGRILPYVAYNKKIFALTGGSSKAHELCRELFGAGLTNIDVVVGERLSYPDERIVRGNPGLLKDGVFDDLSVVFFGNENAVDPHVPLRDKDFIRSETATVPMTKEEIRHLALSKLAPSPKDIVYDIGAGTGSVAVEAARKAFEGIVCAIESRREACRLIEQNRVRHGAYNIVVTHGSAPDCLDGLPVPDKAFIGGSSGKAAKIVKRLVELNPKIRIVANAVSPQSLNQILGAFEEFGLADPETICVNIAKSDRINRYDMMKAQNPVYIISGGPTCVS